MGMDARRWTLSKRPVQTPEPSDFFLEEYSIDEPSVGVVNVRVEYHSISLGISGRLTGENHPQSVPIGGVIPGLGVGVVEASNHPDFAVGERTIGEFGWATHAAVDGKTLQKLDPQMFDEGVPSSASLDILGNPGLTAYFGITRVAEVKSGMTVLISSAAGPVGSAAGQFAKVLGCRVVGIAGSDEKCASLIEQFGFDDAINYRTRADLAAAIAEKCPKGVDVYFDNVGGETTDAALRNMRMFGKIAVCGQTSEYNRNPPRGLREIGLIISHRVTLQGFVLYDYLQDFALARAQIAEWMREGKVRHLPTIIPEIESAVEAFIARFSGTQGARPIIRP
ncbi:MAG: NADP-dependent oxidoreductase [Hyphomonadaceae bacterium]|nr:NADP-dependent oxidoreductase [Hyphomonadaceae bacterium]